MKHNLILCILVILSCPCCMYKQVYAEQFIVKSYMIDGSKTIDVDLSNISEDKAKAQKVCESLLDLEFQISKYKGTGNEAAYKLVSLTNDKGIWFGHYNWEYKKTVKEGCEMGHVFDTKIDLNNKVASYTRCK